MWGLCCETRPERGVGVKMGGMRLAIGVVHTLFCSVHDMTGLRFVRRRVT